MTTPFWANEPSILLKQEFIFQLWPTQEMSFESKLNAITRIIILITILGFLFTRKITIIIICIITLAIIYTLYKLRKKYVIKSLKKHEPFTMKQPEFTTNPVTLETVLKSDYYPTNKKNPFGNVLLTEIMDNPDRPSAAPSFNPDVYEDINKSVKKQTQMLNPGIKNTNKQLYGDLKDLYDLDNSMMRFYSTANTRVTNDQGAYQNYLYGNMYSSKEDNLEGGIMRIKNNWQWINP